jgi:hypothetical protein
VSPVAYPHSRAESGKHYGIFEDLQAHPVSNPPAEETQHLSRVFVSETLWPTMNIGGEQSPRGQKLGWSGQALVRSRLVK